MIIILLIILAIICLINLIYTTILFIFCINNRNMSSNGIPHDQVCVPESKLDNTLPVGQSIKDKQKPDVVLPSSMAAKLSKPPKLKGGFGFDSSE